jgi:hypothetical protein
MNSRAKDNNVTIYLIHNNTSTNYEASSVVGAWCNDIHPKAKTRRMHFLRARGGLDDFITQPTLTNLPAFDARGLP